MTPQKVRKRSRWGRWLAAILASLIAVIIITAFLLTDAAPSVEARNVPTPSEASAGGEAAYQLHNSRLNPGGTSRITFGAAQLGGLSALASYGFRPARVDAGVSEGVLHLAGSYPLPFGRWLNLDLTTGESGPGFPRTYLRIGSLSLSPTFSRMFFDTGRRLLRLGGADIPPLDMIVRDFAVGKDSMAATVSLPVVVDQLIGNGGGAEASLALDVYCRLAEAQRTDPQTDFAVQIQRAFPADRIDGATPESNRAAFVGLAMMVVDKRVGYLANLREGQLTKCSAPMSWITLHGRNDLPKHWALSAALDAAAGTQFAAAMGEWKELVDSGPKQPGTQNDTSGFSFVDLAADRAGFRSAEAAMMPNKAEDTARRLSTASASRILPEALMKNAESLHGADFTRRYGGIDDPRFKAMVESIDTVLDREGLLSR